MLSRQGNFVQRDYLLFSFMLNFMLEEKKCLLVFFFDCLTIVAAKLLYWISYWLHEMRFYQLMMMIGTCGCEIWLRTWFFYLYIFHCKITNVDSLKKTHLQKAVVNGAFVSKMPKEDLVLSSSAFLFKFDADFESGCMVHSGWTLASPILVFRVFFFICLRHDW